MIRALLLLAATRAFALPPVELQDLPPDLPARYGVLGARPEPAGPDSVRLARLFPQGPAQRAGLQRGDIVLAVLPYRVRTPDELSRAVQRFAPGEQMHLLVVRDGRLLEFSCTATDVGDLYFLMGEQGRSPAASAGRHRRWAEGDAPLEEEVLALSRALGAGPDYDALRRALAFDAGRYGGDGRLADVHFALHQPLKIEPLVAGLVAGLEPGPPVALLQTAALHLDLPPLPPAPQSASEDAFEDLLVEPFLQAHAQAERAFAALSPAERQQLVAGIPLLLERFDRSFLLDEGEDGETDAHIQTLRLARRVDPAPLFAAAAALARLSTPEALAALRRRARSLRGAALPDSLAAHFSGPLLYARSTPAGWILVGGDQANYYGGDAALIVDLGGDDTYFNNAGGAAGGRPLALCIDYRGDDTYIGHGPSTLGAGLAGAGLLVDLEGADTYRGDLLSQGAAFCGVGLLWDGRGDDRYLIRHSGQGAGYFGAGLLVDEGGHDLYAAGRYAQGFGGASGFGLLLERSGDDRYLADRQTPSGYGTPGVYEGWSQGVGCGFRSYASGGLGLLLDERGDDRYQAGNFAQGTGYFFGLGLLVDRRGDDRYLGSRYAQGAAAHQAAGALLDGEGNDVYRAKTAASQGAAWDAAVGILQDGGGDDFYLGDDLSQGAAAMNGLGLLRDLGGRDVYRARTGQAQGSSSTYWGGREAPNLGVLIDAGGADTYNLQGRADSTSWRAPNTGLFLDR